MSAADYAAARERILSAAAKRIPRAAAASQARALGLWNGREVSVGGDSQFALVLDLGVFSPVGGHTPALQREARQEHDWTGAKVLDALLAARFTLFRLGEAHPEGGMTARDLLAGADFRIRDGVLEKPGLEGCGFAGRLMELDGFRMTCGSLAPVTDAVIGATLGRPVAGGKPVMLPPLPEIPEGDLAELRAMAAAPDFPARLYRAALENGMFGPLPSP